MIIFDTLKSHWCTVIARMVLWQVFKDFYGSTELHNVMVTICNQFSIFHPKTHIAYPDPPPYFGDRDGVSVAWAAQWLKSMEWIHQWWYAYSGSGGSTQDYGLLIRDASATMSTLCLEFIVDNVNIFWCWYAHITSKWECIFIWWNHVHIIHCSLLWKYNVLQR